MRNCVVVAADLAADRAGRENAVIAGAELMARGDPAEEQAAASRPKAAVASFTVAVRRDPVQTVEDGEDRQTQEPEAESHRQEQQREPAQTVKYQNNSQRLL